jgi:hypothetical protein
MQSPFGLVAYHANYFSGRAQGRALALGRQFRHQGGASWIAEDMMPDLCCLFDTSACAVPHRRGGPFLPGKRTGFWRAGC